MARLSQLKQVLPNIPIMACVRHPIDTIASWKTSFPHLKQALVTDFPVGHVNDPFLAQWQRQRLVEIAATPNEALKRALLWRYLADILLMGKTEQLILIHYEKLVTQPLKVLKSIQRQIPDAPPLYNTNKIIPSTVRQKREVLDKTDLQAIGDICGECAVALGYDESDFTEG
ncbi:MAG: sulfotransferase, partial [Thiomargarita sp.]|nr:sulfotransferase [Thiomargarita sp.]